MLHPFRQLFRRCLSVRTFDKYVNKINAHEFETNSIHSFRTLCNVTKIDDKNNQKNERDSSEIQDEIISKIESIFKCNTKEATEIYNALRTPRTNPNLSDIVAKVKWLRRRNIQLWTILDNYELLLQPFDEIKSVYIFLKAMGWNKPDHILPFVSMSLTKIKQLESFEVKRIRKRVYWLAAELKCDPYQVGKNCVKHPFILFYHDILKLRRKIQLLREYGLSTEDILSDLFNLGLAEENLKRRLVFLKENGIQNLLPWMLRGREKAIQILVKHRHHLNPNEIQNLDNLAKCLKLHGQTAKMLFKRHRFIRKLDSHQMSSVLQFLLEKFTADEIVKHIRMLAWEKEELDRRISEAKASGIECLDPIYLAKSKKEFQKWLNNFAKSTECKFKATDENKK